MVTDKTQNLYVKSFFAASIREALDRARKELGEDALLLNTREAPPEAQHLGAYEVVFGGLPASMTPDPEPEPAPVAVAAPAATRAGTPAATPAAAPLAVPPASSATTPAVPEDLRIDLREIRDLLARMSPQTNPRRSEGVVERALMEADVEPALAREIDLAVRQRGSNRQVVEIARPRAAAETETPSLTADTLAVLESRFEVDSELARVTALVGPPGCGKTTTLVKLAFTEGIAKGRAVRLISADSLRVGGAEQLRTYAAILGVPFQAVENTAALAQAIDGAPPDTLVLIDTPGYSAAALETSGGDLAAFLSSRQDIDTHLVLTATTRLADLDRAADLYFPFQPSKLLFTKLDEASSYAAMFCEAVHQRKAISFLATGQSVPEDLEPAGKPRITHELVRKLPETFAAVA